jgi:hypothetical protein
MANKFRERRHPKSNDETTPSHLTICNPFFSSKLHIFIILEPWLTLDKTFCPHFDILRQITLVNAGSE